MMTSEMSAMLLFVLIGMTHAFVPQGSSPVTVIATALQQSSIPQENPRGLSLSPATTTTSMLAAAGAQRSSLQLPAWIHQPRKTKSSSMNKKDDLSVAVKIADDVEISIGRVAMVASVLLMGQEFVTGESLQSQLLHFVAFLTMNSAGAVN